MSDTALATMPQKPTVQALIARVGDKSLGFGARVNSVGDVMRAMSHQMMAALPKHLTPDRMIRVACNAIRKNPKLLDCSAQSLFGAITESATYGWEIGGVMGHAYLVPYGDEAVLIPGYKGLVDLCRRSGQISTISCEIVHQGDDFRYSLGDDPHIHHKPNARDPQRDKKPITHVYLVVRLRDGGVQRSVWSQQKIDAHKEQYSQAWKRAEKGKKDSFWHTAWPAAAKKTVIRDMIQRGLLPVSAEYREVVDRGLKHDEDGADLVEFDILPQGDNELAAIEGDIGESDAGERPQNDTQFASPLATEADTAFLDAEGISDVEAIRVSLAKKATTDGEKQMLLDKAAARTEQLRAAKGKK